MADEKYLLEDNPLWAAGASASNQTFQSLKNLMLYRNQNRDEYFLALGKFIDNFSLVEISLFLLLNSFAKTSLPIGRAVFSGSRIENNISFIKRIWEIDKTRKEIKSELKDVFEQLTAIQFVRNILIHHGSDPVTGSVDEWHTSDGITALTPKKLRSAKLSAKILDDMSGDLLKISRHFMSIRMHRRWGFNRRAKKYPVLLDAWLYKRPQAQKKSKKKPAHQAAAK